MDTYIQTTEYTTAASSLMLILNHFNPDFQICRESEFRIWLASANLPTRASSIYGLAIIAKGQGLSPEIWLGEKEYDYPDYRFKGYTKTEIDQAKFTSRLYHKRARELGIHINKTEFGLGHVKDFLSNNKVILLRVNAGVLRDENTTSNYVVVYSFEGEYSMVDPLQGQIRVGEEKLVEAFETLVTKSKRDNRMIVF